MKQAEYHRANHLAAEICQELRESQMQMLALATNIGEVEEVERDEEICNNSSTITSSSPKPLSRENYKINHSYQI